MLVAAETFSKSSMAFSLMETREHKLDPAARGGDQQLGKAKRGASPVQSKRGEVRRPRESRHPRMRALGGELVESNVLGAQL